MHFQDSLWIESSKEQHLFEIQFFYNIINVLTVTFDQLNSSLQNKKKYLFIKNKQIL